MLAVLTFAAIVQHLEPIPAVAEPGQTVAVIARDAEAAPLAGIEVRMRAPDGSEQSLGTTDHEGKVKLVPELVGVYELFGRADRHGPDLIVVLQVVRTPGRWLYGLVCVPLGLALLVWNLRRVRV